MNYFIGIDGGGTKTIAYLGNQDKEVLSSVQVGASNYHNAGVDRIKEAFENVFQYFKLNDKVDKNEIRCVCLGGAGIDCAHDQEVVAKVFQDIGYYNDLILYNDSVIALVGANGEKRGGILLSGTGSIAYGIDSMNQGHRVGGWGNVIDDDGSAYAIAREGLKRIMQAYDGRAEETKIWESVKSYLDIGNQEDLIPFIYSPKTGKQDIAAIAPLIIELYDSDEGAREIVDEAVTGLFQMVSCLASRMQLKGFSLGLSGSVLVKSEKIRSLLSRKINSQYPDIDVHLPYDNPAKGALILAIEEQGRNE